MGKIEEAKVEAEDRKEKEKRVWERDLRLAQSELDGLKAKIQDDTNDKKIKQLEDQLNKEKDARSSVESDLKKLQLKIQNLESEKSTQEKTINKLENTISDLAKSQSVIKELESTVDSLEREAKKLKDANQKIKDVSNWS